jgi:hypothetical protein
MKRTALFAFAIAGLLWATPTNKTIAADEKADAKLPAPDGDGFVSIFNGKDLTWWAGLPEYWEVKDGAIRGYETKESSKQTFLVFQPRPVKDFELHLKFKFASDDGNSGIQFRSKVLDEKAYRVGGYQADFDGKNGFTGIIYDEAGVAGNRGIMSNRGEKTHWDDANQRHNEKLDKGDAEIKKEIKLGDWNDVVLVVKGNHVKYSINGVTTTELTDDSPKALKEGVLAFQVHQGFTMDIQLKDIKIKFMD